MWRGLTGQVAVLVCIFALAWAEPAVAQSGDELFAQGEQALSGGDAAQASELYSQAIRSGDLAKERLAQAFLQRGRAQQVSGQHARAVADFTNALWLESLGSADQARAHGWRGLSREALGQNSLASEDSKQAQQLDAQFSAGAIPTASTVAAAPPAAAATTVAAAEPSGASSDSGASESLINQLFGESSAPEAAVPQTPTRQGFDQAPQAVAAAQSDEGPGWLTRLFGGEDESAPAPADGGVTVRRLDPAPGQPAITPAPSHVASARAAAPPPPARSGNSDVITGILATPDNAASASSATTAGGFPPPPRPKPGDQAAPGGPTQLTGQATSAPAPRETSQDRGSLLGSLFDTGSSSEAAPPAAPAPRQAAAATASPETISVSESRVASAPPWTLGATNPTRGEEARALPDIPRVSAPSRNQVAANRPAPRAGTNWSGGGREVAARQVEVSAPEPTTSASTSESIIDTARDWFTSSEPEPAPAPPPVQRAAAPVQIAAAAPPPPPSPRPTPIAVPAPAPAPVAAPAPPVQSSTNVASLDWGSATQVVRAPSPPPVSASAPPPPPPRAETRLASLSPVVNARSRREARRAAQEANTIQPAATRPAPVPAVRPLTTSRPPAPPPSATVPDPTTSVASRMFDVAAQAFAGSPAQGPEVAPRASAAAVPPPPPPAAAPPRAPSYASVPAPAPSSASGYALQVSAQRTPDEARSVAGNILARHGDLLGGVQPYIVRAELAGQGTFYRVRFGPYDGQQQVASICQQLKSRGTDCFTVSR